MSTQVASKKRKSADFDDSNRVKRVKIDKDATSQPKSQAASGPSKESSKTTRKGKGKGKAPAASISALNEPKPQPKPRPKINKLVPQRPFPTVPTSVSATGPRSAHQEGKNLICVTRKTKLGSYLRRCKELVIKDGYARSFIFLASSIVNHICDRRYKTLHLTALGAAIPHLTLLVTSLPAILPFPPNDIHTDIQTGTIEVIDEVLPDDDDAKIEYKKRGKSTLNVVMRIGDGVKEQADPGEDEEGNGGKKRKRKRSARSRGDGGRGGNAKKVVIRASDQQEDGDDSMSS